MACSEKARSRDRGSDEQPPLMDGGRTGGNGRLIRPGKPDGGDQGIGVKTKPRSSSISNRPSRLISIHPDAAICPRSLMAQATISTQAGLVGIRSLRSIIVPSL